MAAPTVADHLLARLRDWGVDTSSATRGTASTGCSRPGAGPADDPQFVQARHEEMAAFEAVGYAKFSGRVGVCAATSRAGGDPPAERAVRRQTRPRAGGGDRRADRPQRHGRLLPAGGGPAEPVQGRGQRLRADGDRARAAAERARPGDPHRRQRAARRPPSSSRRRAGAGVRPPDARVQDGALQPRHGLARRSTPDDAAVRQAADLLNAGQKVAMLVGPGRPRLRRGDHRGRRPARRRRGQGAAGQGRAVRRAALGDRLDRAAGHPAQRTR